MPGTPQIVCLTPIKNESWILEKFLRCTSLWADHIILADQHSDDGSREIARRFEKVTLIENESQTFNEPERQKLLIDAARRIEGPKLLIALDADEFLTANFLDSPEWAQMLASPPGTVCYFDWPTVLADAATYWIYPDSLPLAFMDDGVAPHRGEKIHSPRVPLPEGAPRLHLRDIKVMHFVGTDMDRWRSKIRWYQCWTALNQPEKPMLDVFLFHHKDLCVPAEALQAVPSEWYRGYEERGIPIRKVETCPSYRWDAEVIELFKTHGTRPFRRLNIWEVDWNRIVAASNGSVGRIEDPRSTLDRLVLWWLRRHSHYYSHFTVRRSFPKRLEMAVVRRLLARCGW